LSKRDAEPNLWCHFRATNIYEYAYNAHDEKIMMLKVLMVKGTRQKEEGNETTTMMTVAVLHKY